PHTRTPCSPLFPYTTLFRSVLKDGAGPVRRAEAGVVGGDLVDGVHQLAGALARVAVDHAVLVRVEVPHCLTNVGFGGVDGDGIQDRKSTRLNSSHVKISYAV